VQLLAADHIAVVATCAALCSLAVWVARARPGAWVEGILEKGGSSRRDAVKPMVEALGGSVEGFYFAFGDADAFVILDMPDNVSVAAVAMTVNASGAVSAKTTVLLTPEEVDQATQKSVDYTPPGG
jgi:uncharacterized protein with GYD domain